MTRIYKAVGVFFSFRFSQHVTNQWHMASVDHFTLIQKSEASSRGFFNFWNMFDCGRKTKKKKKWGFGNGRKKTWGRERIKEGLKTGKETERIVKWGRLENIKQKSKAKWKQAESQVSERNGETSGGTDLQFPRGLRLIVLPAICVKDILLRSYKNAILLEQRWEIHSSPFVFLLPNSLQCYCRR